MKPVDVKPVMYIDFNKENNQKGPKLKVEYKNIFAKDYVQIGLKKAL